MQSTISDVDPDRLIWLIRSRRAILPNGWVVEYQKMPGRISLNPYGGAMMPDDTRSVPEVNKGYEGRKNDRGAALTTHGAHRRKQGTRPLLVRVERRLHGGMSDEG